MHPKARARWPSWAFRADALPNPSVRSFPFAGAALDKGRVI